MQPAPPSQWKQVALGPEGTKAYQAVMEEASSGPGLQPGSQLTTCETWACDLTFSLLQFT